MLCHACGQPLNSDAQSCSRCGTPVPSINASGRPVYSSTPPSAPRRRTRTIFAALVFLLVVISIISRLGSGKKDEQNLTQSQTGKPVESAVVDPSAGILNDAKKTARETYVNKMQDEFRNQGVEATISDLDGEMVVISDALKLKPDRDRLMRSAFDPVYRKALCAAEFKTVELKSGAILGDGDTYSLGCPETKEERDARLEAQKVQRQAFVDELQRNFNSDSGIASLNIRVEQGANELIMTGSSANDVPPKMFRSMIAAEFGNGSNNKLCDVGFHGLRVRTRPSSSGTLISFNCGKTSH